MIQVSKSKTFMTVFKFGKKTGVCTIQRWTENAVDASWYRRQRST